MWLPNACASISQIIQVVKFNVLVKLNKLKQELGILSSIRDQRTKQQGNKGTAKSCETREVAYTYRYVW